MSPALLALAEACYPKLDWDTAVKAAEALAIELKLPTVHFECILLDEHKPCRCACCGNRHSIVRRAGVYFNGKPVRELIEEDDAKVRNAIRRSALGL